MEDGVVLTVVAASVMVVGRVLGVGVLGVLLVILVVEGGVIRVVVGCGGFVVLFGVEIGNVVFGVVFSVDFVGRPQVPQVFLHKLSRSSTAVSHCPADAQRSQFSFKSKQSGSIVVLSVEGVVFMVVGVVIITD